MKTNDLRIGNLVLNDDGGVCKLFNIHEGYINHKPIPLTEEWLLKFGFEVYEFDHKANQYRHGNRLLVIRDENCFYDYGADILVKYVHQLQNLYFTLTGEELEVKQ